MLNHYSKILILTLIQFAILNCKPDFKHRNNTFIQWLKFTEKKDPSVQRKGLVHLKEFINLEFFSPTENDLLALKETIKKNDNSLIKIQLLEIMGSFSPKKLEILFDEVSPREKILFSKAFIELDINKSKGLELIENGYRAKDNFDIKSNASLLLSKIDSKNSNLILNSLITNTSELSEVLDILDIVEGFRDKTEFSELKNKVFQFIHNNLENEEINTLLNKAIKIFPLGELKDDLKKLQVNSKSNWETKQTAGYFLNKL